MIVLANGMFRGGSTYQYNLARSVIEASCFPLVDHMAIHRRRDEGNPFKLWPAAKSNEIYLAKHHVWEHVNISFQGSSIERLLWVAERGLFRVLYVHRDVRDTVVSTMEHHGKTFAEAMYSVSISVPFGVWMYSKYKGAPWLLAQRYDDLIADPLKAVLEIGGHIGVGVTESQRHNIVKENSLESREKEMKQAQERFVQDYGQKRFDDPLMRWITFGKLSFDEQAEKGYKDPKTLLHMHHVSRFGGRSGMWKEVLTDEQKRIMDKLFGGWMDVHGYERAAA